MRLGFTLVEILVVLAVIGIALSIGFVGLAQMRQSQESRAGIQTVRQMVLAGATLAASRGLALELVRGGNRLNIRTQANQAVLRSAELPSSLASQLPNGVWLEYTPAGMVVIPSGFTNPFSLTDRGKTYSLRISLIGEVRLEGL